MAHDKYIPDAAPGIAGFNTESIGSSDDPLFGDTPATTTTTVNVPANFSGLLYEPIVIGAGDIIAKAVAGTPADGILTAPVVTGAGVTTTIDVYRSGHWNMAALKFGASYDTDAKKKVAFEGGKSPTIFVSKKKFSSDAIAV